MQKIALDVRRVEFVPPLLTQFDGFLAVRYPLLDSDTYFYLPIDCVSANKTFDEGEAIETINIEQPNMKFKILFRYSFSARPRYIYMDF